MARAMRVHIVGVSGSGMGALAGLLSELGHQVSGSDVAFRPPIGPRLAEWGVECLTGYAAEHLRRGEPDAPDLVVIGNVCRRDNPEASAALESGLEVTHLPGALQQLVLPGTTSVVVAGTHGKTTTTSLVASLLDAAGLRPGFLIGGIPRGFGRGFRAPARAALPLLPLGEASAPAEPRRRTRPPFVIEGDEYDTAFFEKTPKFLHYRADVAVITSLEHDHVDIYPDPEAYRSAFRRFIRGLPEDGLLVANGGDPEVVALVRAEARSEVAWVASQGAVADGVAPEWLAAIAAEDESGTSFDLFAGGVACGRFFVPLSGRYNVENAVAALAVAAQGFGVRLDLLRPALARFAGVGRRQERLGEPGGVLVYDDFAHHPTAVRETLRGLRSRHPRRRLIAAFEPRSATACRALHQAAYVEAFDAADLVVLAPLGRSGLPAEECLDTERLARDLVQRGRAALAPGSNEGVLELLLAKAAPGDVVALLSNGDFGGVSLKERLVEGLATRPGTEA